jgi:hypothetical protein
MPYSNLSLKAGKIELYEDAGSSDGNVLISANRTTDADADIDINLKPQSKGTIYASKEDKTSSKVGGGFDAAGRVDIYTNTHGTELITIINIKLGSNISSFIGTDKIIGENGNSSDPAYFIDLSSSVNGIIYKIDFICTTIPNSSTGNTSIGIYTSSHDKVASSFANTSGENIGEKICIPISLSSRYFKSYSSNLPDLDGQKLYFFTNTSSGSTETYSDIELIVKLYGIKN